MKELNLNVEGMHCSGCENRIKNMVSDIKNVKEVTADHETGTVKVICKKEVNNEIINEIKSKIESTGDFKVVE